MNDKQKESIRHDWQEAIEAHFDGWGELGYSIGSYSEHYSIIQGLYGQVEPCGVALWFMGYEDEEGIKQVVTLSPGGGFREAIRIIAEVVAMVFDYDTREAAFLDSFKSAAILLQEKSVCMGWCDMCGEPLYPSGDIASDIYRMTRCDYCDGRKDILTA
jgi:hypothetical protein